MKKNDITYEYRVFTNRLIDVESMEVGICTSKVIKELNGKNKVDGRFFHTSDTDEWFFCWNGELQKLNLKGNSDVNSALEEVKKLIDDTKSAVNEAKAIANEAKNSADVATKAAEDANAAVENIENKADKSEVEKSLSEIESNISDVNTIANEAKEIANEVKNAVNSKSEQSEVDSLKQVVNTKADASIVEELSAKVESIPSMDDVVKKNDLDGYAKTSDIPTLDGYATQDFVKNEIVKSVPTKVSELENDSNYLTEHQDITGKQDIINDLDIIRSGAALGATSIQSIPEEYITETELSNKGYLTVGDADLKYAPIGSEGVDLSNYATKEYVGEEIGKIVIPDITGKQDIINDIDAIRSGAALGATSLQEIPSEYVTESELNDKGYLTEHQDISGKQDVIDDLESIRSNAELAKTALQSIPEEYVTEDELTSKGYATIEQVNGKQDIIDDLENIRSGAALGATSLQSIPEEYITETELSNKGYLTTESLNDYTLKTELNEYAKLSDLDSYVKTEDIPEIPSMDNYYTIAQIDKIVSDINKSIGEATELTDIILNA